MDPRTDYLQKIRWYLFERMLNTVESARTGHLGACCSSLDLMTVLYFGDVLRYDFRDPKHLRRDYVLNRGHLGPLKYNIFGMLGWLEPDELNQYRSFGSRLAGHEDMHLTPGVDITPSGSLGMPLSYAVGAAIGWRDQAMHNRVFCFLGDGEEQEGNVSEAARHAAHLGLRGIIAIIDRNGGQLSTRLQYTDTCDLEAMWRAYGWHVVRLSDGHNHLAILRAYREAETLAEVGPVVIIADTVKGNGIPGCKKDYCGYHVYHNSEPGETVKVIDLSGARAGIPTPYQNLPPLTIRRRILPRASAQSRSEGVATCSASSRKERVVQYDVQLELILDLERQHGERLYVLTSDYPPRAFVYGSGEIILSHAHYINVGLREQHMTALIQGLKTVHENAIVVVLCGDAFLYRHMDQLNALAQSGTHAIFFAVQGGLSGAKNGATHESSGQPGALLTMPGVLVEEPCTGEDLCTATNRALSYPGPAYIRMHRLPVPWKFQGTSHIGYQILAHHVDASGTIVTCGLTSAGIEDVLAEINEKGRFWNAISITSLTDLEGAYRFIQGGKPLHLYYNGYAKVLTAALAEEIFKMNLAPSSVESYGFQQGCTGSVTELLAHFELDAQAIVRRCTQ